MVFFQLSAGINDDFHNSLNAIDKKLKSFLPKLRTIDKDTWSKEYNIFMDEFKDVELKYCYKYKQLLLEKKLYYISLIHPIKYKFINNTAKEEKIKVYISKEYEKYIIEKYSIIKQLDKNSMQLVGLFAGEIIELSNLPDKSPILASKLDITKNKLELMLSDFIENSRNKKCSANLLLESAFHYSKMKKYKKAEEMCLKLKNDFPENENVKSGTVDKQLKSLKIIPGIIAPNFSVNTISGEKIYLSDFKGKFLFLEFWSYGCFPSKLDVPNLNRLYNKISSDSINVLGITCSDMEKIKSFIKEQDVQYPIAICNKNIMSSYGIYAFPTSFLIAPSNVIIAKNLRNKNLVKLVRNEIRKYFQK